MKSARTQSVAEKMRQISGSMTLDQNMMTESGVDNSYLIESNELKFENGRQPVGEQGFFLFFFFLCFVLFCFVLFCFVLFCFVLFCFVLFCFVLSSFVYFTLHFFSFLFFSFLFFSFLFLNFFCFFCIGGTATVFRATYVGTPCAVKVLKRSLNDTFATFFFLFFPLLPFPHSP